MDIDELGHGFCLASGFISNYEQLRQVEEIGLEITLLNDWREADKILNQRFSG
jgi:formate dehydrogenase assembly factor FdhD